MAPKKTAESKSKKKAAAPKKKKATAETAGTAGAAQIGHNSRIPSKSELSGFFLRIDKLFEEKREKNSKFMADIKAVYEEAANKFGSSRKIVRTVYQKKQAEEAFADFIEELEPKERDDLDRMMAGAAKAFGDDTPFGSWCAAQGNLRGNPTDGIDEIKPDPVKVVKTAAEVAAEHIAAEERAIQKEQTTH